MRGLSQEPPAGARDPFQWQTVAPDGSQMQVQMPGEPRIASAVIRPVPEKEVEVHLVSVSKLEGKALFMVGYHDLDFTPADDKKIKDVLDGGVKGTVLNTLGKLTKLEPASLGKHPGRRFEYAGNRFGSQIRGTSRIFLVGTRIYQLTVLSTPEVDVSQDATRFFDSFQLQDAAGNEDSSKATEPSGDASSGGRP
jgi:hypothetical protein